MRRRVDIHYLIWGFRRTGWVSLLYVLAALLVWVALGSREGLLFMLIAALIWVLFFAVHLKDPRAGQRYSSQAGKQ